MLIKNIIFFIVIILFNTFILIFSSNPFISIIGIIGIQICTAMIGPIVFDIENKSIPDESKNRATILSAYSMISSLVGIGTNLILSMIINDSIQKTLIVCLVMCSFSLIGMLIYAKWVK